MGHGQEGQQPEALPRPAAPVVVWLVSECGFVGSFIRALVWRSCCIDWRLRERCHRLGWVAMWVDG
jgi:hypothetical protein